MLPSNIKIQKSPDYTFAVSRVRVWESRMLSASVFYQLADARNLSELASMLSSTVYGKGMTSSDFDSVFNTEEIAVLKELKKFLKDDRFLLPFFYKRDFYNLKLLAKSKFTDVEDTKLQEGLIEKEKIAKAFDGQELLSIPKIYQDFLSKSWNIYEKTGDWQMLDMFLEQKLYEQILNVTKEFPFAGHFFRSEIDLINIRTFMRCKNRNAEGDLFGRLFINGGLLDKYFFGGMGGEPVDKLFQRLKFTPYDVLADIKADTSQTFDKFYEMENRCYLVLLRYLSCAKYTAFGYEPVLRYVFLKNNEIKNLRTIFVGKMHNVPSEEIKARIGPFDA
ncbi:MAG: V-type ATPase subunit [Candidatus Ratteibacteria bacterium]|nr:V-type ATPase subunit [Candidatus Ratteibacteria bacterium]